MVYRIDNRPKKNRGKYTILGVILGIIITIGGFYVYDNYKQPIIDSARQIKNTAISEIPKSNPLIKVEQDPVQQAKQSQPQEPTSNIQPENTQQTSYSLDQLQQITLDDINNYRTQNGLQEIPMNNAKASQIWADHLLSEGCIAHREGNSGPEQRYIDNGDKLQMVFENVSGGYGTNFMSITDAIKQANSEMVNNDADQNNAHRDNILNPNHVSVSIGIAYNTQKLILVEDFQEPMITNWQSWDMSYSDVKSCW